MFSVFLILMKDEKHLLGLPGSSELSVSVLMIFVKVMLRV